MTRKISSFIFIGLIFTLAVWMSDKNSVITVDWRGSTAFPFRKRCCWYWFLWQ